MILNIHYIQQFYHYQLHNQDFEAANVRHNGANLKRCRQMRSNKVISGTVIPRKVKNKTNEKQSAHHQLLLLLVSLPSPLLFNCL